MTPRQQVQLTLQGRVRTPADLWVVWPQLQAEFPGCSIMLVADDAQHFRLPARRTYGKARLISGLAGDSLFFLNARIYQEMSANRSPQIPVDYSILFDTSTASLLRTLLAGKVEPVHQDLRMLLEDFRGNHLNWHIRPYLDENHRAILRRERGREIFETVLATEKLSALNGPAFLASGRMSFTLSEAELHAAALRHISDYARLLANGWAEELEHRWLFVHTLLLKLALLELREPGRASAKRKLGEFVRFMDEEVGAISLFHVVLAAERFKGGRRAALLDHFTGGAKGLVSDEARRKLATFTAKVKERLCQSWNTPEGLASALKSAIMNAIETDPKPGWVRADTIPSWALVRGFLNGELLPMRQTGERNRIQGLFERFQVEIVLQGFAADGKMNLGALMPGNLISINQAREDNWCTRRVSSQTEYR